MRTKDSSVYYFLRRRVGYKVTKHRWSHKSYEVLYYFSIRALLRVFSPVIHWHDWVLRAIRKDKTRWYDWGLGVLFCKELLSGNSLGQ